MAGWLVGLLRGAPEALLNGLKAIGAGIRSIWADFLGWLIWTVVLGALAPVLFLFVLLSIVHNHPAKVADVVGHGELFLIAALLTVGDIRSLRARGKVADLMHGISLVIVLACLVIWSGVVAEQSTHPGELTSFSAYGGAVVLLVTLVCGAISRSVTGDEEE